MTAASHDIGEIVRRYPGLAFLQSETFRALPAEKQRYLLECAEDALFWVEWDQTPRVTDGFKFLMAAYGLNQAETQADAQHLEGRERNVYLKPHKDLYSLFNPQFGTESPLAPSPSSPSSKEN